MVGIKLGRAESTNDARGDGGRVGVNDVTLGDEETTESIGVGTPVGPSIDGVCDGRKTGNRSESVLGADVVVSEG